MHFRQLGRTGLPVSDIGYGLWGMSGWTGSEDIQSLHSLQLAVDLGCTFFDSAWDYGGGKSDHFLGTVLKANPGNTLVAASKVPPMNQTWPASPSSRYEEVFPPAHVFAYADKIRAALQTDSIDLLQFHVWDDSWTDNPEFRQTVEAMKTRGIVKSFGLSLNRWQPWNGLRAIRTGLVDAVQVIYNIFDQAPEDELFPLCREMNIGVIARVPLDEGSLGGKMTRDMRFPSHDWRAKYFNEENLNKTLDRVDSLQQDLPQGMPLPELAIRFILSNPIVSTLIIGMRKPEHVRANLALGGQVPLSAQLLNKLKVHRWDRTPQAWSD